MKSWIESANDPQCHFPLNNLPYGIAGFDDGSARCVSAIGDEVVDLSVLEARGLISASKGISVFDRCALNDFMELGVKAWDGVRAGLIDLLREDGDSTLKDDAYLRSKAITPINNVSMRMPFRVAEFTDFYAGRQHAINVGTMFRGAQNALPPNWLHVPIAYNARASTVVVSGTPVRRPCGQIKSRDADVPDFGPCKFLDFELELGAVVGLPSTMGEPISVGQAQDMIFGFVILNDWSARDIQAWESQPLGPFQAKAFATSISPWVVTRAALEAFRISTPPREETLLPYLDEPGPMLYDITLEVRLQPEGASAATIISQTGSSNLYYSAAQQLAHHASSGCKMNTGDLLGSGTISGLQKPGYGSLLELSWGGKEPLTMDTGEIRTSIEDGDTITMTGWAQGDGYRIGFGECSGRIIAATHKPNTDVSGEY